MKPDNRQPSELTAESKPDPEFIAQQLCRPSGSFAPEIGENMNQVNEPLYDLIFDVMEVQKGDQILDQNGFLFEETGKRMDPEVDFEGTKLRLESCCIVAEKAVLLN